MKVSLKEMFLKEWVLSYSKMAGIIQEIGKMELNMEKEFLNGQMDPNMMDIILMMKEKDMEFSIGQMVKNILDYGNKDYFMVMDKSLNLMVLL